MLIKVTRNGQFDPIQTGKIYARHYATIYGRRAARRIDLFFEHHSLSEQ